MLFAVVILAGAAFPDAALDFTVKNASAPKVYAALGAAIGKSVTAECVAAERLTLSLPNAKVQVIFDALDATLGVTHDEIDGGTIEIRCLPSGKLPPGTYLLGGAILAPATPALREYLGAPGSVGMWVRAVSPESPAATAGLRIGDLVIDADEQGIGSAKDFDAVLAKSHELLQTAELRVLRAKETYRFAVLVKDNRTDPKSIDRLGHDVINRADRERKVEHMPKLPQ